MFRIWMEVVINDASFSITVGGNPLGTCSDDEQGNDDYAPDDRGVVAGQTTHSILPQASGLAALLFAAPNHT